jgi:hypothetical protein
MVYTFVMNNASDFSTLCVREQFHAGLVIIVPNVTPTHQRDPFRAVLVHTGGHDLINAVVEVDVAAGTITLSRISISCQLNRLLNMDGSAESPCGSQRHTREKGVGLVLTNQPVNTLRTNGDLRSRGDA